MPRWLILRALCFVGGPGRKIEKNLKKISLKCQPKVNLKAFLIVHTVHRKMTVHSCSFSQLKVRRHTQDLRAMYTSQALSTHNKNTHRAFSFPYERKQKWEEEPETYECDGQLRNCSGQ